MEFFVAFLLVLVISAILLALSALLLRPCRGAFLFAAKSPCNLERNIKAYLFLHNFGLVEGKLFIWDCGLREEDRTLLKTFENTYPFIQRIKKESN